MSEQKMIPIWYFVGLILLIMGGLILSSGIYNLITPPVTKTILSETHPDIWWGAIMVLFGGGMFLVARKQIS